MVSDIEFFWLCSLIKNGLLDISLTLYSRIVRVVGYVIRYSVGYITCKLVCSRFLTLPFLILYL